MSTSMPSVQEVLRPLPITPPDPVDPQTRASEDAASVVTAIHVISTERAGLANLEHIYRTDRLAQENFGRAVTQIVKSVKNGGKLVVCGVGKSGKIGQKLEATMNSLGIYSAFLHPTEALHGDLGMIRPNDTLILISFSGRTPELQLFLPHVPPTVPIIAITAHMHPSTCPLLSYQSPDMGILLPAPIHEDEDTSFGVCAPTTSTTVALALGDALALATAKRLHTQPGKGPAEVFKSFHPGGAIGAAFSVSTPTSMSTSLSTTSFASLPPDYLQAKTVRQKTPETEPSGQLITEIATPLRHIPTVTSTTQVRLLDILLAAIQNPNANSWVKLSDEEIIPPHRLRSISRGSRVDVRVSDLPDPIGVGQKDWLRVSASSTVEDVRQWLSDYRRAGCEVSVVCVVDDTAPDEFLAVVEAEDVCGDCG
ncbi:hypothetical protein VTN02DRAFT_4084 [Thermoascus thermophilus]